MTDEIVQDADQVPRDRESRTTHAAHLHTGFDDRSAHRLAGPREVEELVAGARKRSLRGIWEDGRLADLACQRCAGGFNGPTPHWIPSGRSPGIGGACGRSVSDGRHLANNMHIRPEKDARPSSDTSIR